MSYHRYTEEEKQYLRKNINKYTYRELADVFNLKFKTVVSWESIAKFCNKQMKMYKNKAEYKCQHNFSSREKQFLRDNINKYTYRQLTELFNAQFGTNLKEHSISDMCLKRMGVRRDKPFKFSKGRKDFVYTCPIGTESRIGDEVFVKVANNYHEGRTPSKGSDSNWKRKQVLIYERAHGEISRGNLIIFLDKNRNNFNVDNLYCTTREVNFMMAKNRWYTTDREVTLVAIKWCELFYALKNDTKGALVMNDREIIILAENEQLRTRIGELEAEVGRLRETLEHICEYWNRDTNEKAMSDALWEIIATAEQALSQKAGDRWEKANKVIEAAKGLIKQLYNCEGQCEKCWQTYPRHKPTCDVGELEKALADLEGGVKDE